MSHRKRPSGVGPGEGRHTSPHPRKRRHYSRSRSRSRSRSPSISASGDRHRRRKPTFPSYKDFPDLPPKIRLLCEIVSTSSPASIPAALDDAGVRVTTADVESVLRLSYSYPAAAASFFRWAGHRHLSHHHSPYSWNLLVDLLGKNSLFPSMWDAVRSMLPLGLLSLATFASVFSSLAASESDPFDAFLSMPAYGLPHDAAALNSLLSALCRAGRSADAIFALHRVRAAAAAASPDADSFAILLEGCENESNAAAARQVFDEMVSTVGWHPGNVPAYDSFLATLVAACGAAGLSEAMHYLDVLRRHGCSPGTKFFRAALAAHLETRDARGAMELWDEFVGRRGVAPDRAMYHTMISLQCYSGRTDVAVDYLDDMTIYGVFPDTETYNLLLQFLLEGRKLREAGATFREMVKNECWPSDENYTLALRMFMDTGNWEMGVRVWKCMVANGLPSLEENGNMLVAKLRDMERLPEACKYAEEMIDKGIKLSSSTLSKLKQSLLKVNKGRLHDHLLRKWKAH